MGEMRELREIGGMEWPYKYTTGCHRYLFALSPTAKGFVSRLGRCFILSLNFFWFGVDDILEIGRYNYISSHSNLTCNLLG